MLHCTDLGSGRGRYAASTVRCVACDLHRMGWGLRVEVQQGWIIAVIPMLQSIRLAVLYSVLRPIVFSRGTLFPSQSPIPLQPFTCAL